MLIFSWIKNQVCEAVKAGIREALETPPGDAQPSPDPPIAITAAAEVLTQHPEPATNGRHKRVTARA